MCPHYFDYNPTKTVWVWDEKSVPTSRTTGLSSLACSNCSGGVQAALASLRTHKRWGRLISSGPRQRSVVGRLSQNTGTLQKPPHSMTRLSPSLTASRSTPASQPSLKRSGWSHPLIGPYQWPGQNGALLAQLQSGVSERTNKQENKWGHKQPPVEALLEHLAWRDQETRLTCKNTAVDKETCPSALWNDKTALSLLLELFFF